MKHAFLITAYDHFDLLYALLKLLDHQDTQFYIHIDKKSDRIAQLSPYINKIRSFPNVIILQDNIKVNWGAFSHTQAIILLLKEAVKDPDIAYFHTLSAQDFPIHGVSVILDFFEKAKQNNLEYISYKAVPTPTWKGNQGLDRFQYYHLNDCLNPKNKIHRIIIRITVLLQKYLFIKRPYPEGFDQLYGGHVWWSLSRNCIIYLLEYINKNPDFVNRFKNTHCSEEILFQTIIINSHLVKNVVNNNLRYVEMQGASPKILKEEDYEKLINSDRLFARKMSKESEPLIEKLKNSFLLPFGYE